jgi:hypothetical protein
VLDLMCSHFVLTLAAQQGGKFNVRRDLNGLMSLAGRHLVWPAPVLAAPARLPGPALQGQRVLARPRGAVGARLPGAPWRLARPYEEGTLFFYLDEYAKDAPKDLLAVLAATGDWLSRR